MGQALLPDVSNFARIKNLLIIQSIAYLCKTPLCVSSLIKGEMKEGVGIAVTKESGNLRFHFSVQNDESP